MQDNVVRPAEMGKSLMWWVSQLVDFGHCDVKKYARSEIIFVISSPGSDLGLIMKSKM